MTFLKKEGFFSDASKQAEKEKEKLESQLQQAQKMEAMEIFAGGIAHDFNNILFSIIGYSEMLSEKFQKNNSTRQDI